MDSASILSAVWILAIAANVGAALRFYQLSLHEEYRYFWTYLLVQSIQNLLLVYLPLGSPGYFWVHVLTEPPLWVLYILVVRELYSAVFQRYQGIYTVTRWTMYAAWSMAIAITVLSLVPAWRSSGIYTGLYYVQVVERGVVFSLALFILLVLYFLSRYPIQLHRNTVVHCALFSILFLADAAALLVTAFAKFSFNREADIAVLAVSACCYSGWALLLTREGEAAVVTARRRADPAEEDRLLQQLNAMNQTLLRAIRK